MSVSLEEVLKSAGYEPCNDIDDAEWLIASKDEFDELFDKAEQLDNLYDQYWWEMQALEDDGDTHKIMSFEEWRKNKQK